MGGSQAWRIHSGSSRWAWNFEGERRMLLHTPRTVRTPESMIMYPFVNLEAPLLGLKDEREKSQVFMQNQRIYQSRSLIPGFSDISVSFLKRSVLCSEDTRGMRA